METLPPLPERCGIWVAQKSNEMRVFLSETLPSASNLIYAAVAGFLALAGKWLWGYIQRLLTQNTPEATARALKTTAEAKSITVQSSIDAATAINQIIAQMLETQRKLDEVREEMAVRDTELGVYEVQNRALKALLDLHGITYEIPPTKKDGGGIIGNN